MNNLSVIILAAGKGVRMESEKPKVLHTLYGKPMLEYVLDTVRKLSPKKIYLVTGCQAEKVKDFITGIAPKLTKNGTIVFVLQENQLGSGHAVACIEPYINNYSAYIIILYGDMPLISTKTLKKLIKLHRNNKNDLTLFTAKMNNPYGYGRIMRDEQGNIVNIKEELDLTESEKNIDEVNVGVYCIDNKLLFSNIKKIEKNVHKSEYYLTDIVKILSEKNKKIGSISNTDINEIIGINTTDDLRYVEKILKERERCTRN